jgi:hypothetical protein
MAGLGVFPICHHDKKPYHVPTQCPLLANLGLKLVKCQPAAAFPSPPTAPNKVPAPLPSPSLDSGVHTAASDF